MRWATCRSGRPRESRCWTVHYGSLRWPATSECRPMASVGGKSSNEVKMVASGMKQLASKVSDLRTSVATIEKLQTQINKKPDECKKAMDLLEDEVAEVTKSVKALEGILKNTSKGVTSPTSGCSRNVASPARKAGEMARTRATMPRSS